MGFSHVISTCLFLVSVSVLASAEPALTTEQKKLAGTWSGWVVDGRGENPRQRRMKIEVTIKGDTITAVEDGSKSLGEGTFVAQIAKDGKNMNATRTSNPGKGQTYNGIYSLDGDTLKWCVSSPPGRERPTDLVSKTGQFLMVLTKEKK